MPPKGSFPQCCPVLRPFLAPLPVQILGIAVLVVAAAGYNKIKELRSQVRGGVGSKGSISALSLLSAHAPVALASLPLLSLPLSSLLQAEVLDSLNTKIILTVVLFTSGGLVVTSIMGIIAVLKRYKKLLMTWVIFTFVIFAVQLAVGAYMLTLSPDQARDAFREDSMAGMEKRNSFQNYMQCCGWNYGTEEFFPERVACLALHPQYTDTCRQAVGDFIDTWITPTAILMIVSSCLQFVGLVGSVMIVAFNRQSKEDFFDNAYSG